jgi:hypothetical protein
MGRGWTTPVDVFFGALEMDEQFFQLELQDMREKIKSMEG